MYSEENAVARPPSNDLRAGSLDDVDQRIVDFLAANGRAANNELAQAVGIAASTAHGRVRALLLRGVISGFHAAVDQAAVGNSLQAMIGVTLRGGLRQESITEFTREIRRLHQVVQLFFVSGADDFLVHVAVQGTSELRRFVVEHLSGQRSVASTRTSVIFEYHRNGVAAEFD